jgi:hypothetical protein
VANASTAYQALGAARAWMYAEEDRIGSKLDAAEWARGRGHDRVLERAAAFQRGRSEELPDRAEVARLMADARAAVDVAGRPQESVTEPIGIHENCQLVP